MKRLGYGTSVHILSNVKRSIFSSAKRPATGIPISKRLLRSNALPVSIAVGVLLVGLILSPSMRGMFTRGGSVAAFTESISIFESDCTTPPTLTDFTWGDTVCAKVTGAPFPDQRRLVWVAPNGEIAQQTAITSDPQTDTFSLNIQVGDRFRQPGTWSVRTINNDADSVAAATFVVHDTIPRADLSVSKSSLSTVIAGNNIEYTLFVYNAGPDAAVDATLTEPTPPNTTFVSETQDLGPAFTCSGTGPRTCTIGSLAPGAQASFTFVYNVNAGTPDGTVITNTATVSSSTSDQRQGDNSATFDVTVTGSSTQQDCTITCPADVTVNNNPNAANPCVAVATYGTATISGTCTDPDTGGAATVACSPASGSTFPVGTTTVTCSTGGVTCTFTVKVVDQRTSPTPTIQCPSDITTNENPPGAGSATVNYTAPSATGNCVQVTCNPPSGSSFNIGTTPVNCTATDFAEPPNTASCTFNVIVSQATPCTLTCPNNITQNNDPGACGAVVAYAAPTQQGSCGTVSCIPPSNSFFPVGTTTVNCTGIDSGGNTVGSCSFTVTINDTGTLTCPANIVTTENPPGSGPTEVNYQEPTACPGVTVTCNPPSGSLFPLGTTTVTCTPSAGTGCSFTVTVTTSGACTITCPDITKPNAPGQCGAVVGADPTPFPTKSGDCGSEPIPCEPASGSFFPVGTTSVTCDLGATTCSFTVTVNDTQAPSLTCPGNITKNNDPGLCSAVATYTTPTATDNCPGVGAVSCSPASGSTFAKGTTTVTCSATDAHSNTGSCSFTVTVNDNEKPTVSCPADITQANDTGLCSAVVSFSATASDNCPGATANCSPASGSTFPKGTTTVTCSATDTSGNTSATTCSFTVTVNDNENPTISCPSNMIRPTDPNVCSAVVSFSPTASDNCPGVTYSCVPPSGSTFPKGTTTVTCTATDTSSHTASCSFTVTVIDTQPPAITCPANITKEPTCPTGAVATFAATASDNCPGVTVVCNPASGSVFPVGTTTVTCTATDTSGNTAACSFTVRVKTPQEVIQDLINRVQALQNLTGQQSQGLVSKLNAALDAVNDNKINVACNKLNDFIGQVQGYINNGTLTSGQGQPLINSAANVRNYLGCTNLPCS